MKVPFRFALIALFAVTACAMAWPAQAQTLTTLHSFKPNVTDDGYHSIAALLQGKDGNFYGTTFEGGQYDAGTIFKISPTGTFTILHSFDYNSTADGFAPVAALVQGSDGNFYGTTIYGGMYADVAKDNYGGGTVFKIAPDGTGFTLLHSFDGTDGYYPQAPLVQGSDGSFYGTTPQGGQYDTNDSNTGGGTVFKITSSGAFTTLHSFNPKSTDDGSESIAALVQGSDGSFYGTTFYGGQYQDDDLGGGTVFKITSSGAFTLLHSFNPQNTDDGSFPQAALIQATDGSFYGTTNKGGQFDDDNEGGGTVFKVTSSGSLTVLHSFDPNNPADGSFPEAALIQATDGNFYGTTSQGGTYETGAGNFGGGTAFKITSSGSFTLLHSFGSSSTDGVYPEAALVQGTDGNFYGTTSYDGENSDDHGNGGTVFTLQGPPKVIHFVVTASPSSVQAGTAVRVTVTAEDADGEVDTDYTGTVHFTSTDKIAGLPANATLSAGTGTFSVTLNTTGTQTVTATDTVTSSITGTSGPVTVTAGPVANIVFVQQPTNTLIEEAIAPAPSVRVTDAYGNAEAATVVLSLASGDGTLGGTTSQKTDATGTATFSDLSLATAGTKTLTATVSGTSFSVTSSSFTVIAAQSVTVNPTSVVGGNSSTGTVTLSSVAPSSGEVITLKTSDTTDTTIPASVTVPSGATSVTFTITTKVVTKSTAVTIKATLSGASVQTTLTLTAATATLTGISVTPSSVQGGTSATGKVTLSGAAPSGGAVVTLKTSDTTDTTVPASVTVPSGATSATFTITTKAVAKSNSVTFRATLGSASFTTTLTLTAPTAPTLTAISVSPPSVVGGSNSTGTVTLSGATPTGGEVVTLKTSDTTDTTVPATVTVAAGATSATFTITTKAVTKSTSVTFRATLGSASYTTTLTLTPSTAPAPTLTAISVTPTSVQGGAANSTGTVTLSGAAPTGGTVVSLKTSSTLATTPAAVTVAAGSTSATFTITTSAVTKSTGVTVKATLGTASVQTTLTLTP